MPTTIALVKKEFYDTINDDNDNIDLKELKKIITKIYNSYHKKEKVSNDKIKTQLFDSNSSDEMNKNNKKSSKKKTDDKKKKQPTAYNIFVQKNFSDIKDKYPEYNVKEIMKLVAAKWKALDEHEKNMYYMIKSQMD